MGRFSMETQGAGSMTGPVPRIRQNVCETGGRASVKQDEEE